PDHRRPRAQRRHLLLDERARRAGGDAAVVGGREHRRRRSRAGRAVRQRGDPSPGLRILHPHPRPLRARAASDDGGVRRPQDDVARRPARRADGPWPRAPGDVRRPHGIRPDHRDRPRYVRAAAPALGGYRVCLRERAGGGETREAHRRPAGARAARPGLYAVAVTLGRLLLAWVPVAAWFLIAGWAGRRLAERTGGEGTFSAPAATRAWTAGWTTAEAGVVTLFASLWFDSLGSGGW